MSLPVLAPGFLLICDDTPGTYLVLHARDFIEGTHTRFAEARVPAPSPAAPRAPMTAPVLPTFTETLPPLDTPAPSDESGRIADAVQTILGEHAAGAIVAIDQCDDAAVLDALSVAERSNKGRKSVLMAIDARVAQVTR